MITFYTTPNRYLLLKVIISSGIKMLIVFLIITTRPINSVKNYNYEGILIL